MLTTTTHSCCAAGIVSLILSILIFLTASAWMCWKANGGEQVDCRECAECAYFFLGR